MTVKFTNNAYSTLASSINSSVTTVSLAAGTGARFPSLGSGEYFYATIVDASNNLEIIKVTARSTDTLTVVRGQDGTSARSFAAGDRIELRVTAAALTDLQAFTPTGTISATTIAGALAELDTEKAPLASPTFTGTPAAPTAAAGTSSTQLATTAFVQAALQAAYPVGSIYINASSTTNPATLLGFGTWVEFGSGRVLVGQNASDTSFDTLEETGGSKDSEVVSHTHTFSATSGSGGVNGSFGIRGGGGSRMYDPEVSGGFSRTGAATTKFFDESSGSNTTYTTINYTAAHTHSLSGTTDSTGSSGTNGNLQPYIVVRMWKRTA